MPLKVKHPETGEEIEVEIVTPPATPPATPPPAKPAPKLPLLPATPASDDDDDDPPALTNEKLLSISQATVDSIVQKGKAKEARKFQKQLEQRDAEIVSLRELVAAGIQAEVEALPEEVKALAPGKADTAAGLKALQSWLPGAKALAAKLGGKPPEKKAETPAATPPAENKEAKPPVPGNGNNPPPAGGSDQAALDKLNAEAAKKAFSRW